jgi:NADH dehydrogenase [ubiquinone] 1 alpha subcomplex assembly factor 6
MLAITLCRVKPQRALLYINIGRHFSSSLPQPATATTAITDQQNFLHNRTLVQSRDFEAYTIGLLHAKAVQPSFFALRAFHVEIASIQAKESSVAAMRMKWWFDIIQTIYSPSTHTTSSGQNNIAIQGNPTIRGLTEAIQSHNLTQRFLERMVETRMGDLEKGANGRFDSVKDMITFFERTNSTFLFLDLECCGVIDEQADMVANCVGIASGIVNMIRSIGAGNVGIPRDLMDKHGVQEGYINDPTKLIDGSEPEARRAIQEAVKDMAMLAGDYLSHARAHQGKVPRGGKSAMLPAVSALRYLERLKNADYDVMEEKVRNVENMDSLDARFWRLGHMLYLGRAHLTGVF